MAAPDLNKLQQILQNAEANEVVISQVRKSVEKINALLEEVNSLLDPSYVPAKKERKPREASASGKRPGRPRKTEAVAESAE